MDPLIPRIQAGDRSAAVELIAQCELSIRVYAAKVSPRPDLAEDIAQKAFLVALKSIQKFDPSGNFVYWMQGIVRNVARNEWEQLALHSRVERDGLAQFLETLAQTQPAREEAGLDERLNALRQCVQSLAPRSREILQLRYGMEMKCQEISEKVGTSTDAVKMSIFRIRATLRQCIKSRLAEV